MSRRQSRRAISLLVAAAGAVVVCLAACSSQRSGSFDEPSGHFGGDGSADAPSCPLQCSLDGREVIRSCSGEVVERCETGLACGAGRCQEPCAAAAADQSSNGCDFYLQPPRFNHTDSDMGCFAAYVVNASDKAVELTLSLEGKTLDLTSALYTMVPGEATLVPHVGALAARDSAVLFVSDLDPSAASGTEGATHCPPGVVPASFRDTLPDGTGFGHSFRLEATAPVSLTSIYPFGGASSYAPTATLVLPVASWGTEHILINAWSRWGSAFNPRGAWPAAQIMASEDETDVTIRPTRAIEDGEDFVGTAANKPATYRLQRGQLLQLVQAEELTGSIVTSTKPTLTVAGHEQLVIPTFRPAADFAGQQIPPFEKWGSEYVGAGYRPRIGDDNEPMPYRIVAARDGTRLDYDPAPPRGAPITMSAGEVATFDARTGEPFVVRSQDAEHPFYLAAYMIGGGAPAPFDDLYPAWNFLGNGDPEFVNVVPARQYLNSYSFFADPTYDETSLVLIRAKRGGAFERVWLECAGDLADFKPVGTRGDYEWTRVDLVRSGQPGQTFGDKTCSSGLQRMHSDGPFTATIWGWSRYASYAYPGGMAQRSLVNSPLSPVN